MKRLLAFVLVAVATHLFPAAAAAQDLDDAALAAKLITAEEHARLARFAALRDRVIAVDDFPQDFGRAALVATLVPAQPSQERQA